MAETILLVEDDERVRTLLARVLKSRGYTVLEAASGEAAQCLCDAHCGAVDLLLSDVVMEGLNGPDLWAALAKRAPNLRSLFISGYSEDVALDCGASEAAFLQKPFSPAALLTRVREALKVSGRA